MRKVFWVLIGLSVGGAAVSLYQTHHFFDLKYGLAGFTSFCNINQKFNCSAVESSRFAELLPGRPLSAFAAGGYLGLLGVLLLGLIAPYRKQSALLVLIGGTFSLLTTLLYLIIMTSILKIYCVLCLFVDAINVLFFLFALAWWKQVKNEREESTERAPPLYKASIPLLIGGLFVPFVISAGMHPGDPDPQEVSDYAESFFASIVHEVPSEKALATIGPENAPLILTKFSDFQCPSCKMGALVLHPLFEKYKGKIKFVYRNYPLDQACNRQITHPIHPFSCEAAKVGVCARKQGKFMQVYEAMFEHQEDIGRSKSPVEIAVKAGLDQASLEACVKSPETLAEVQRDIEEGIALDVKATPTFFLNGRKLEGPLPPAAWIRIFDQILQEKK